MPMSTLHTKNAKIVMRNVIFWGMVWFPITQLHYVHTKTLTRLLVTMQYTFFIYRRKTIVYFLWHVPKQLCNTWSWYAIEYPTYSLYCLDTHFPSSTGLCVYWETTCNIPWILSTENVLELAYNYVVTGSW